MNKVYLIDEDGTEYEIELPPNKVKELIAGGVIEIDDDDRYIIGVLNGGPAEEDEDDE